MWGAFELFPLLGPIICLCPNVELFITMFPPTVPNDPLVPTAVLGETGYVIFITSNYPLVITHSHRCPCACCPALYTLMHH